MLRIRTRSLNFNLTGLRSIQYYRVYDNPNTPLYNGGKPVVQSYTNVTGNIAVKNEEMTDKVTNRPGVYVDPKTLRWKRVKYPSLKRYGIPGPAGKFGSNRPFWSVKPCSHTVVKFDLSNIGQRVYSASSYNGNWTNTHTLTFANPFLAVAYLTGASPINMHTALSGAAACYSAGPYKKIDWFALTSDFTEACESFTKNKFLAGEALYECEIFVSAFKVITNPLSALSTLTKFIRKGLTARESGRYRKMKMGEFVRSIKGTTRKAVNAHLSYDFAVKPAIEDLKATLSAHSFVSRRMDFLSKNAGHFVPIRVRQILSAEFENAPPAPLGVGVTSKLYRLCESKDTIGTISAWGRVRQDLDWNDTWSAYLQYFGVGKLIGLGWELIPFSFVVDWVTNAQEYIDNMTRLRTGGPFGSIKGVCASTKEVTSESIMLNLGYLPTQGTTIKSPSGTDFITRKVTSSYSRSISIPETSGLVDFSNLGSFQKIKLAELIFQLWSK